MPASLTRVCPVCKLERATPDDFRDQGETGRGRPPAVCRVCRDKSPELTARQARNVEQREERRERHREYAARPLAEIFAHRHATHPSGRKTCPDAAGCGRSLRLSEFGFSRYQHDGLQPVCRDCLAAHVALSASRHA